MIYNGGDNVCMKGFTTYTVEKITREQLTEIQNDFDPIEAPPGPYRMKPEHQGNKIIKLIFTSNIHFNSYFQIDKENLSGCQELRGQENLRPLSFWQEKGATFTMRRTPLEEW